MPEVTGIRILRAGLLGILLIVAEDPHAGSDQFRPALPGYQYRFPDDLGSHDDFQTEWWYYTGHLKSENGRSYGFQLTFFRRALGAAPSNNPSSWSLRHLYFAHFAMTDEGRREFRFAEKVSRAGIGKAGAATGKLAVWIDHWRAEVDGQAHLLRAESDEMALRLRLVPAKPAVVHGSDGISRKGSASGEASHYYSFTRMRTEGFLTMAGETFPVSGVSWMDHEFGSNQLGSDQVGWDWFSFQFEDGTELMLYRIRRSDGSIEPASGGTWIGSDGSRLMLRREDVLLEVLDYWTSPKSGARYPARWQISVPVVNLTIQAAATVPDQELVTRASTQVTYWEGSVSAKGQRAGREVSGLGYVEMTGYASALHKRL
jgi:predicted secreted hydrolase